MNALHRTVAPLFTALALLPGGLTAAQAAVVNHLIPFGLTPWSLQFTAVAIRLPAGNEFAYVDRGIIDGPCITYNRDCLLADRGWLAMPTADDHIAAATGPVFTDPSRSITSWAALHFSADPVLSPLFDLDIVLFGLNQTLLGGYRWSMAYDSSLGYYRQVHADYSPWAPTWGQVFAVPLPGTLALALPALALLAGTHRRAAQGVPMNR